MKVGDRNLLTRILLTNTIFKDAELCSGSTEDFGSFSPGSNPGSAAMKGNVIILD